MFAAHASLAMGKAQTVASPKRACTAGSDGIAIGILMHGTS